MSSKDNLEAKISFLRQVLPFAELSEADLAILAGEMRLRTYHRGETIFRQGDDNDDLFVVREGKVRVFKLSPAGHETSINIFVPHDILGEFAAIDRQPRSATAKAISSCALLAIAAATLLQRMRHMPDLAIGMARLLVGKARWTAAYAETIAQYDAPGRLLHILLLYNQQFGKEIEPGRRYELDLSLNQSDLASLVGARREWVNRILRDWRTRGLIAYEAGKITILDLPQVETERDSRIEANQQGLEW